MVRLNRDSLDVAFSLAGRSVSPFFTESFFFCFFVFLNDLRLFLIPFGLAISSSSWEIFFFLFSRLRRNK